MKSHVRKMAARTQSVTGIVRPQTLAKYDAPLIYFRKVVELAREVSFPIPT